MIRFTAFGHKNITGTHVTTLEFTRDSTLTPRGDCILGVEADFDTPELRDFLERKLAQGKAGFIMTIKVGKLTEVVKGTLNSAFDDQEELVIRRSSYSSNRTFGLYSDKACVDFKRSMIKAMQNPEQKIMITIK